MRQHGSCRGLFRSISSRIRRGWLLLVVLSIFSPEFTAHAFSKNRTPAVEDSWGSYYPVKPTPKPITHGSMILRFMTYNVHGLPIVAPDTSRFTDIARIFKYRRQTGTAPHVLVLQEAFTEKAREIVQLSGYPYVAYGPQGEGVRFNAGLIILSEFPITQINGQVFSFCTSWDCFSRKGVMHARINVPGLPHPLEVFNTHMNSDVDTDFWTPEDDARDARFAQAQEIREFLWRVKISQAPGIFGGDFNFRPGDWDYSSFVSFTGMRNAMEDCGQRSGCVGEDNHLDVWTKAIDHNFYIEGRSPNINMTPVLSRREFTQPVNGRKLSDHDAIEAHFKVSW